MGMFDYVKVEVPLPDGRDGTNLEFQTKYFDWPQMETYVIRKDGRLVAIRKEWEDTPEDELPEENKNAPEGSIFKLRGIIRVKRTWEEVLEDFHGDLDFGSFDTTTKISYEYVARFTNGHLQHITFKHKGYLI